MFPTYFKTILYEIKLTRDPLHAIMKWSMWAGVEVSGTAAMNEEREMGVPRWKVCC